MKVICLKIISKSSCEQKPTESRYWLVLSEVINTRVKLIFQAYRWLFFHNWNCPCFHRIFRYICFQACQKIESFMINLHYESGLQQKATKDRLLPNKCQTKHIHENRVEQLYFKATFALKMKCFGKLFGRWGNPNSM